MVTNEKYMVYDKKSVMTKELEGLLKGCYTFLSLDKEEQKKHYDYDKLTETAKMLRECY